MLEGERKVTATFNGQGIPSVSVSPAPSGAVCTLETRLSRGNDGKTFVTAGYTLSGPAGESEDMEQAVVAAVIRLHKSLYEAFQGSK